ncbi:MAG: thrombospondin type 3 repeat-containing protein, partial [Bradymonadia bacterium]
MTTPLESLMRIRNRILTAVSAVALTAGLSTAANAQAQWTTPDGVTAPGITGTPGNLINGDLNESSGGSFFQNIDPGVEYFEFTFNSAVEVSSIRLYNDFGSDDDGVERFDLEMLDGQGNRISYLSGFTVDNGPSTVEANFAPVAGVRAIRLFVIEAQFANHRCQIREVMFFANANPDADGDGVNDDVDNCPNGANADQADGDADGLGDVCDACPADAANDVDGDGVCGDVDNCPTIANGDQTDDNGDTYGDACVSPLANIPETATLGSNLIIGAGASIGTYASIGDGATVNGSVGNSTVIGAGSVVPAGVTVGNSVRMGA